MRNSTKLIMLMTSFLFCQSLYGAAELRLEPGSYANRNHIDAALGRVNLNFRYVGCDEQIRLDRFKLTPSPTCKQQNIEVLAADGSSRAVESRVGEVAMSYDDQTATCETKVERRISINRSIRDVYKSFKDTGCNPTHLVFSDGTGTPQGSIKQALWKKGLCQIPYTHIKKPGFPTDNYPFFNFRANDKGFKIGNHTEYFFDHNNNSWCLKDVGSKRGECQESKDWADPIPMVRYNEGTKRYHVDGAIELLPDGRAIVRAIDNKSFASMDELSAAKAKGVLTQTNPAKGRIEFRTRRKSNGLTRSIVRTYDQDTPGAPQRRAVNFFARNVMGIGITNTWCDKEHCFEKIEKHAGVPDSTYTDLASAQCKDDQAVDMNNGGNGNLCRSCVGMTPGHCAIEKEDVEYMAAKLKQSDKFTIMDTGEYRPNQKIEIGLHDNFKNIVTSPKKPGCYPGHAPAFREVFDPGEGPDGSNDGSRATANESKSL